MVLNHMDLPQRYYNPIYGADNRHKNVMPLGIIWLVKKLVRIATIVPRPKMLHATRKLRKELGKIPKSPFL